MTGTAPLLELLAGGQTPVAPAELLVAAHPDDEVIGNGAQLPRFRAITLLHVTDGAPRNGCDAVMHGFVDTASYAAARRGKSLAAFAISGIPGDRALSWGLPETSDYLDALAPHGREASVMAGGFQRRAALVDRFDIAEWPQLRPGSLLLEAAPTGWVSRTGPDTVCPATALPSGLDALGRTVSRKTQRDLRAARKRAAEAGALQWRDAEAGTLGSIFDALLRLHAARWETRGEAGVLNTTAVQAAHRAALPELLRAGLLRLQALHLNDSIVAVLYALIDPPRRSTRRVYRYISGFDPALDRLSPGMLRVGQAMEQAVTEGFAALDFLRGEDTDKYFRGAEDAPRFRRILHPPAGAGP